MGGPDEGLLDQRLDGSIEAIRSLRDQLGRVAEIAGAIRGAIDAGGTLYTAGNGGSAAHALHLAEELIGRYRSNRPPRRAVCLCADPTALTCIANDFGYEEVFARPCRALLGPGDVLLVLSTSGKSPNLVRALEAARERNAKTIGLLGPEPAACGPLCDLTLHAQGADSAHIQEAHQVVIHMICELMEE
ncbi:MAG: D-sedoheptulose-7-phosphate isomerase [Planctomycetota bacterium]|jgi:D-sedoheptulose 7-phosphate isomerase